MGAGTRDSYENTQERVNGYLSLYSRTRGCGRKNIFCFPFLHIFIKYNRPQAPYLILTEGQRTWDSKARGPGPGAGQSRATSHVFCVRGGGWGDLQKEGELEAEL